MARNQNHLSRVYPIHLSIHVTSAANIFARFQLDMAHPFYSLKKSKLGSNDISSKINYMFVSLAEIHGDHIIRNRRNDVLFVKEYFIIAHKKTIL